MKPRLFLLLALAWGAQSAAAQAPLDPALLRLRAEAAALGPAAPRAAEPLGLVVHTRDADALRRAGFVPESRFDGLATVRVEPSEVAALQRVPGVTRVELGEPWRLLDDEANAFVGAAALHAGLLGSTAYTGAGALVCVIDSGIDWRHLDFRSTADPTQSRVVRLWDVSLVAGPGEAPPAGFSTGVEYTQAHLNDELDGTPTAFVRSQDTNGHGTLVAGMAASNGGSMTPRRFAGVAPGASLAVVKLSTYSNAEILNGLAYCGNVATALGLPVAVNLSIGSDFGPHDGQDAVAKAITTFTATAGRAVVQAAGNSGALSIHRTGTLAPGASVALTVTTPAGTAGNTGFGLDVWSRGRALALSVQTPNGHTAAQLPNGDHVAATSDGDVLLFNHLVSGTDRWDGDNDRELAVLSDAVSAAPYTAAGTWTVTITNNDTVADTWHAWLADPFVGTGTATFAGADATHTTVNTSPESIVVGAVAHRWCYTVQSGSTCYGGTNRQDLRATFSSQGPSRDGRTLPHLVAPGQGVFSARSADAPYGTSRLTPDGLHVVNEGTSFSAPVAAGSAALLLAATPTLTAAQVQALLQANTANDGTMGALPNNEYGAGKLNIYQAMAEHVNASGTATQQIVRYDAAGATTTAATLGAGTNLVLRFAPAITGPMRGLLFHTGTTAASGGYTVRLWNDGGGGTVGTQIGPTVAVPAASVHANSWTYVDTNVLATDLVAGTDYYISVTAQTSDGSFRHDAGTTTSTTFTAPETGAARADDAPQPAGGSDAFGIGTLTAQAYDALVRPVLTTNASALPVELVLFEAARDGRRVRLVWATASETDNAGWTVEHRAAGAAGWADLAFVEGAGTTSEAHRYAFGTAPLAPGRHAFRLRQVDTDGAVQHSGVVAVEVVADRALALVPAGPNPFSDRTALLLTVAQDGPARVALYDVLGRRVQTLFDGPAVAGDAHALGVDAGGLGPGTYVVRADAGGRTVQRTLRVVR